MIATVTPLRQRLRLPGPCPVPERVRQVIATTELNHRGPEFKTILKEIEALAKPIFGTENEILLFGGSGTGVMEASLVNILAPGERVLVAANGQFSERMKTIAVTLGAKVDEVETEWGRAPDPAALADRLAQQDYRAVLVVHNESATGAVADLAAIGRVIGDRPTLLIVDTVSGLGAIEMRQDAWGVDIAFAASQKALMSPPGVGLVSVSPKAWRVVMRNDGLPRFFWDFRRARASLEKDETPFTPPVTLVAGLCEAMRMIHEEGLPQVLERHRRLSTALRTGCEALGFKLFTDPKAQSNSVTVLHTQEGLDAGAFVRHMRERYGTLIVSARPARLNGRVIRFGTMGYFTAADIITDLEHLELSLRDFGRPVRPGAGVEAAMPILDSSS
jgi:aspartate aminotransferase-like enzyme